MFHNHSLMNTHAPGGYFVGVLDLELQNGQHVLEPGRELQIHILLGVGQLGHENQFPGVMGDQFNRLPEVLNLHFLLEMEQLINMYM